MGFDLTLVNPFFIKQLPGKKSDVKDAKQIATYLHKGMLRGSMIPPAHDKGIADLESQIHASSTRQESDFDRNGQNHGYAKHSY